MGLACKNKPLYRFKVDVFFLLFLSAIFNDIAFADTIYFKNGTRLDVPKAWRDGSFIKTELYGAEQKYPINEVEKIVKADLPKEEEPPPTVEKEQTKKPPKRRVAKKQKPEKQGYLEYKGSGDDVISIEKPNNAQPALAVIVGNRAKRHFAVLGYDSSGSRTGTFVNTTDFYKGVVPIDLGRKTETPQLEIKANGSWEVTVFPIGVATKIDVPGKFESVGDNVIWLNEPAGVMEATGNKEKRHFAAKAYDKYGRLIRVLINTTQPYRGKVIVPKTTKLIEFTASGPWAVALN